MKAKEFKHYKSTGFVYGKFWMGGEGSYPANSFESESKKDLINQCTTALNNGSLDFGMGFEALIGAILNIETITTIQHNGKEFKNSENCLKYIGKLTPKQKGFLLRSFDN